VPPRRVSALLSLRKKGDIKAQLYCIVSHRVLFNLLSCISTISCNQTVLSQYELNKQILVLLFVDYYSCDRAYVSPGYLAAVSLSVSFDSKRHELGFNGLSMILLF